MVAGASGAGPSNPPRTPINFFDLPQETQQAVAAYCSQSDLIRLALVCRRAHALASAQLYRSFHIVFPDDDDINYDSPIDGLAGGLDTFTTSDYNHARHLRDLSLDTLSPGLKGELSCQAYQYSASCGKFLNTLLHLTLRRAKYLETFRWNIRVEMSRPVYRELHQIASLTNLHVRMPAGDILGRAPVPLPGSDDVLSLPPPPPHTYWHTPSASSNLLPLPAIDDTPATTFDAAYPSSQTINNSSSGKLNLSRGNASEPATFSGFRNLKALSVLDIDNFRVVPEIRTCIKKSYSSLRELQLSLSDSFAQLARKPVADSDIDDSDSEDGIQVNPISQTSTFNHTDPMKSIRAQEERKLQEVILAQIFDAEQTPPTKSMHGDASREEEEEEDAMDYRTSDADTFPRSEDLRRDLVLALRNASAALMAPQSNPPDSVVAQQDAFGNVERAARKFLDSLPDPAAAHADLRLDRGGAAPSGANGTTFAINDGFGDLLSARGHVERCNVFSREEETTAMPEVKESQAKMNNASATEAIAPFGKGIESPAGVVTSEGQSAVHEELPERSQGLQEQPFEVGRSGPEARRPMAGDYASSITTAPTFSTSEGTASFKGKTILKYPEPSPTKLGHLRQQVVAMIEQVARLLSGNTAPDHGKDEAITVAFQSLSAGLINALNALDGMRVVKEGSEGLASDLPRPLAKPSTCDGILRQHMVAYARDTRGLSLVSLSIFLIPVNASVLSKAVDLSCLKQLTLLNVGNQSPFWDYMGKENATRPLALRSVFTDHVTPSFLLCISGLPELHELFLLERRNKRQPESLTPRSKVSIHQIRRSILKQHLSKLKRLSIRDESREIWDVDAKTLILICKRGYRLSELALGFDVYGLHAFMQHFPSLANLRAVHILHCKNDDACVWASREILHFTVDVLSHHPKLKLEWIAVGSDTVDRVLRPTHPPRVVPEETVASGRLEPKLKNKAKAHFTSHLGAATASVASSSLLSEDSSSESDSGNGDYDDGTHLRLKTLGPLQFYDAWGIKIFDKETRSGRL